MRGDRPPSPPVASEQQCPLIALFATDQDRLMLPENGRQIGAGRWNFAFFPGGGGASEATDGPRFWAEGLWNFGQGRRRRAIFVGDRR